MEDGTPFVIGKVNCSDGASRLEQCDFAGPGEDVGCTARDKSAGVLCFRSTGRWPGIYVLNGGYKWLHGTPMLSVRFLLFSCSFRQQCWKILNPPLLLVSCGFLNNVFTDNLVAFYIAKYELTIFLFDLSKKLIHSFYCFDHWQIQRGATETRPSFHPISLIFLQL